MEPVETPEQAHERLLADAVASMPASVLRVMAPGSDREVQRVIRLELWRFIRRAGPERFATVGDAWNAWIIGKGGYVSLSPVRCPECQGRGFSVRAAPSGSAVCRRCAGRRNVTVRQRVVRSPVTGGGAKAECPTTTMSAERAVEQIVQEERS